MNTNIFIPQKIEVGFQERNDTYTGKLSYVIYYDQKNVLRKEKSWNGWRNKKIPALTLDNSPLSGFVINKKVGGYSTGWNHRNTYVRVYDPRDFEFEISVPNLLYILENTNSIKGKGLEGDFVYGWDGTELVLIPVESPDYEEISTLNTLRHNPQKITGKDLILGATYKSKDNRDLIYLGRFYEANGQDKEVRAYFFHTRNKSRYSKFAIYKSLTNNILNVVNDICVEDYAALMDELVKSNYYSERDPKKDKYVEYTYEEFIERSGKVYCTEAFFSEDGTKYFIEKYRNYYLYNRDSVSFNLYNCERNHKDEILLEKTSLEKIFNNYKPHYLVTYKSNDEIIKEWRTK